METHLFLARFAPSPRLFTTASSVAFFSSSWEKESCSLAAMELNDFASSPSSSSKPGSMREEGSPCSMAPAPDVRRSIRRDRRVAIRSMSPPPRTEAIAAASMPLRKKSW